MKIRLCCRNMLSLIEACHRLTRAQVVAEAISRTPYLLPRPLPISHTHKSILAPRGERMQDFNTSHNASEKLYYAILSPLSITPILPNLKMSTKKLCRKPDHHRNYTKSINKSSENSRYVTSPFFKIPRTSSMQILKSFVKQPITCGSTFRSLEILKHTYDVGENQS
jgi:hypothetical protein